MHIDEFLQFDIISNLLILERWCETDGEKASCWNRKLYRGMLLLLLQNQDNWIIRSNAETDEGYSDISIETPEKTGIVIEVK